MHYLRVIGAGFGRTGTMSLHDALNILGYRTHHMVEIMHHPETLSLWEELHFETNTLSLEDRSMVLSKIYEDYDATVDFPGACVWPEMIRHNPNAKVILSLHPKGADEWYNSSYESIFQFTVGISAFIVKTSLFARWINRHSRLLSDFLWRDFLKGTFGGSSSMASYPFSSQ